LTGIVTGSASADFETKDGYAVGTALGRYWNSNLRSELEFAFRNNSLETVTASATGLGSITADLDGKVNSYSGMYNLYYDLGSIGQTPLRPYVGGGAGFAFLNFDVRSPALPGVALDINSSSFAYQGMVGLAYQMTDRINLFSEYRVFGFTGFDAALTVPAAPLAATLNFDGYTHNIFVGARISVR